MSKDARFWRNVTLIAIVHVALIAGLIRWCVEARSSSDAQSIVWLSGAEDLAAEEPDSGESAQPVKVSTPPPELKPDEEEKEQPLLTPSKEGSSSQTGTGKTGSAGKGGRAGGGSSASEFGWYGNMLHDRFYSAWIQPTTNVASGTKISTLVKVRIEKDGRVSSFEIIR